MKATKQITASRLHAWASSSAQVRRLSRYIKGRERSRLLQTLKRREPARRSGPGKTIHVNFSSDSFFNSCVGYALRLRSDCVSGHGYRTSGSHEVFSSSGLPRKLRHLMRQAEFRCLLPTHGPVSRKLANGENQCFHRLFSEDVNPTAVTRSRRSVFRCATRQPVHETDDEKGGSSCSSMCQPACACRPSLLSAHYLSKLLHKTVLDPSASPRAYVKTDEFFAAIAASHFSRISDSATAGVLTRGEATGKASEGCADWRSSADRGSCATRLKDLRGAVANESKVEPEEINSVCRRRAFEEAVISSALAKYREMPLFIMSAEHHLSPEWLSQFIPTQELLDILEPEVRLTRPERTFARQWGTPISMVSPATSNKMPRPDRAPLVEKVHEAKRTARVPRSSSAKAEAQAALTLATVNIAADMMRGRESGLGSGARARNRVILVDHETRVQSGLDSRHLRRVREASLVLAGRGKNGAVDLEPVGTPPDSGLCVRPIRDARWVVCGSGVQTGRSCSQDEAEAARGTGDEVWRRCTTLEAPESVPDEIPVISKRGKTGEPGVTLEQREQGRLGIANDRLASSDLGAFVSDAEIVGYSILARMTAPYLCIP